MIRKSLIICLFLLSINLEAFSNNHHYEHYCSGYDNSQSINNDFINLGTCQDETIEIQLNLIQTQLFSTDICSNYKNDNYLKIGLWGIGIPPDARPFNYNYMTDSDGFGGFIKNQIQPYQVQKLVFDCIGGSYNILYKLEPKD